MESLQRQGQKCVCDHSGTAVAAGIQLRITINFHNSWLSHVTRWNFDEKCNFFFTLEICSSSILAPSNALPLSTQIETSWSNNQDDDDVAA